MDVEYSRRLLMTTDTVGGVWHQSLELAEGLCRRNWQVTLAAMGPLPSPQQRAQAARIGGLRLIAMASKLEWMSEPWDDVCRAGEWLLELAAAVQAEVVHLNQFAFGALAFDAPRLVVAHSSVTSWWRAVHQVEAPPQWDRYRAVVRKGLAGAGAVAAPTHDMLRSLQRDFDLTAEGLVLPNGRRAADFAPGVKEPLIFAAGRLWDEAKNLAALERAAPRVSWQIVVAGPTRQDTQALQGSFVSVRLLGELPPRALAELAARAAILAHPARYEPFGLCVLEAALAGCALVLGDIPSLRELWGPAALYVDPCDDGALALTLQRLIDDGSLRHAMAAHARQRALAYSADAMVDAYDSAYRSLAGQRLAHPSGALTCVS